ncbi:MAG: hypothetical protein H8F28_11840 [Fibrella sp.]|nr:hypothetical protein [Armatimonadota bacterium]
MKKAAIAPAFAVLGLLLLSGVVARAQDDLPEPPPLSAAARPAAPAGSFGVWMGPAGSPDAPIPKGLEPLYLKRESTHLLGIDPVLAFTSVGSLLVSVEGRRDPKTRISDFSLLSVRTRTRTATGFAAPGDSGVKINTGDSASIPVVSAVAIPGKERTVLVSRHAETGEAQWVFSFEESGQKALVVSSEQDSPFFPLVLLDNDKSPRVLALRTRRLVVAEYAPKPDAPATAFTETRIVPVTPRVPPASAACVGEFAGDRKQIVAALGSGANSPVAFAGLRSKSAPPDTEDEFAPGIIAAWRVPDRALPFLVTARNTGADEGTDNPEGRVVLSLWHADVARWMSVWESPPMGKKIIAVATVSDAGTSPPVTKLMVLCEDADGSARLTILSPTSDNKPSQTPIRTIFAVYIQPSCLERFLLCLFVIRFQAGQIGKRTLQWQKV